MKTNKLHRKALYGYTHTSVPLKEYKYIEMPCAIFLNEKEKKKRENGEEKNNMFKSLMAYETKQFACICIWYADDDVVRLAKTATTKKEDRQKGIEVNMRYRYR